MPVFDITWIGENNRRRYQSLSGINCSDESIFDVITFDAIWMERAKWSASSNGYRLIFGATLENQRQAIARNLPMIKFSPNFRLSACWAGIDVFSVLGIEKTDGGPCDHPPKAFIFTAAASCHKVPWVLLVLDGASQSLKSFRQSHLYTIETLGEMFQSILINPNHRSLYLYRLLSMSPYKPGQKSQGWLGVCYTVHSTAVNSQRS